jgi:hypothetical protein
MNKQLRKISCSVVLTSAFFTARGSEVGFMDSRIVSLGYFDKYNVFKSYR